MLCQFTIKNYKSFSDENTLDLQSASISEHPETIIQDNDGESFLPVSVIYGPNGAGKSNILEALFALKTKITVPVLISNLKEELCSRIKFSVQPFLFSESGKNNPTEFEIFFRTQWAEYRYILHLFHEAVVYERLDRIKMDTNRKSALIYRNKDTIKLKGDFAKLKISNGVSENLPLLSYLGVMYANNEIVKDVMTWFMKGISLINYGNPTRERILRLGSEKKDLVIKIFKEMDLDIEDFRIEEIGDKKIRIFTKHVVDGYEQELELSEESNGTQKIFSLVPFIVSSLSQGSTLVIDELDAKIHPVLLKHIIQMYTNPKINRKGAQLIFTSHDLSTMNSDVFRRDEIWFVAKANRQNSNLYSLVEFKTETGNSVRKDAKFDKQYLEGKYGADPYLQKIINWGEINE